MFNSFLIGCVHCTKESTLEEHVIYSKIFYCCQQPNWSTTLDLFSNCNICSPFKFLTNNLMEVCEKIKGRKELTFFYIYHLLSMKTIFPLSMNVYKLHSRTVYEIYLFFEKSKNHTWAFLLKKISKNMQKCLHVYDTAKYEIPHFKNVEIPSQEIDFQNFSLCNSHSNKKVFKKIIFSFTTHCCKNKFMG